MRARMSSDDSFGPHSFPKCVFLRPHILTHRREISPNASTIKLERILPAEICLINMNRKEAGSWVLN